MRIGTALARISPRLAFWALAGVALFLSHDAIFLAQVGPGEALARSLREAGHDYWGVMSIVLALIGVAVAIGTMRRLRRLRRQARALGVVPSPTGRKRLVATWMWLFAVVVIGFVVQENVEHQFSHMHAPGLGTLLGPEYPLALPVIGLITGFAALLASATGVVERELLAVIVAALRQAFGHAPPDLPRPPLRVAVARISPLARSIAGRAPPRAFVQLS